MDTDTNVSTIKDILARVNANDEKRNDSIIEALIGHTVINRKKREAIIRILSMHVNSMLGLVSGKVDLYNKDEGMFQNHSDLLKSYESKVNIECEISSIVSPPKSAYVLVKCMRDCGTIIVPSGQISITKGSVLYVAPEDVKNLIDLQAVEVLE